MSGIAPGNVCEIFEMLAHGVPSGEASRSTNVDRRRDRPARQAKSREDESQMPSSLSFTRILRWVPMVLAALGVVLALSPQRAHAWGSDYGENYVRPPSPFDAGGADAWVRGWHLPSPDGNALFGTTWFNAFDETLHVKDENRDRRWVWARIYGDGGNLIGSTRDVNGAGGGPQRYQVNCNGGYGKRDCPEGRGVWIEVCVTRPGEPAGIEWCSRRYWAIT